MLLAPAAKTKRSIELVQLLLTFASFCTVVAASGLATAAPEHPGYHAAPLQRDAERDRRFSDLARFERKRRESEQQASRRSLARKLVAAADAADDPDFCARPPLCSAEAHPPLLPVSRARAPLASHSRICASCRVSETLFPGGAAEQYRFQALAGEPAVAYDLHATVFENRVTRSTA